MKIILSLTFLVAGNLFANELSWINEQIDAIKPARIGIENNNIKQLKNPVIFLNKKPSKLDEKKIEILKPDKKVSSNNHKKPKKRKNYQKPTLNAIINDSILINNQWHKVGDIVDGFKIIKIVNHIVVLKNTKETITLSTKSRNNIVSIKKQ